MSIFHRLFRLTRERSDFVVNPLALTDGKRHQLRQLTRYPEWQTLLELLDNQSKLLGEKLLQDDPAHYAQRVGEIKGLRSLPLLVDQILAQEDAKDAHRQFAERAADRIADARKSAGAFSPYFGLSAGAEKVR